MLDARLRNMINVFLLTKKWDSFQAFLHEDLLDALNLFAQLPVWKLDWPAQFLSCCWVFILTLSLMDI